MTTSSEEQLYAMALTRLSGFSGQQALQLYLELGSATAIYEHRNDIRDVLDDCSPRLVAALKNWGDALRRAEVEQAFCQQHRIKVLTPNDACYPQRLNECQDAPVVLYYMGSADLNQQYIINIIGTRRCTQYGQDLIQRFVKDLRQLCPQVLIVSGLAYGIDICAHRHALEQGFETVGVLAHGLDQIYPTRHKETAKRMLEQGGLLTEYMTQTEPLPGNFVSRNRIVAGMSDATILVESAAKGGGLITCSIARSYCRDVFAFPGAVGALYSEGCNRLIRDNGAALITSAEDLVNAMGWQTLSEKPEAVERQMFVNLTPEEQQVVSVLQQDNDLQLNILSVRANIPIGQLTALLFQMEMKGIVKALAGGTYHLFS